MRIANDIYPRLHVLSMAQDETDGRTAAKAGKCGCGNYKARAARVCGECQGYDYTLTPEQQRLADLAAKECFGGFQEGE